MNRSWAARATIVAVALAGIAATLASDGNARGAAALAARYAMIGDDASAARWLERGRAALQRRGCTIRDGAIAGAPHAVERALEFDVRDDAARAWWRKRSRRNPSLRGASPRPN